MAERTRGGVSGFAVAMVIFIVLFVVSLVVGIWGWSEAGKSDKDADAAKKENAKLIGKDDKTNSAVAPLLAATTNRTVVGQLAEENGKLKGIISGNMAMPLETIKTNLAELKLQGGVPLEKVIADDRLENTGLADREKKARDEIAALEKNFKQDVDERAKLSKDFEAKAADFQKLLKAKEDAFTDISKKFGEDNAAKAAAIAAMKTKYDKDSADMANQLADRDKSIREKEKQIADLKSKLTPVRPGVLVDLSVMPKGKILRVSPDDNLVYIDRGLANHVVLGMTFEVYERNSVIGKDQFGDLARGKATITVVNVTEPYTATARIVRQSPMQPVVDSDVIGNIAYDPNIRFNVFVYGDFDIEYTGQGVAADKKRIEAMVTDWGSKLMPKLSYDTDLLVLGQEPALPEPLPKDTIDRTLITEHEQKLQKYKDYQEIVGEAEKLKIPKVNQNKFLILTGYYQRVPGATPSPLR